MASDEKNLQKMRNNPRDWRIEDLEEDRAVRHYVEAQRRENFREQLKAGYRTNAERDLAMAAEWFPLEEEAWQTYDASRKSMAGTPKPVY